jgi:hypothetical protein
LSGFRGGLVTRLLKRLVVGLGVLLALVMGAWLYAGVSRADAYTLYRNSALDMNADGQSAMRIHIATFDAKESGTYNQENCETARKLFQQQPGVTVKYWCEKGRYEE